MYQSGWAGEVTLNGSNGPNCQTGLIWATPPSMARTAVVNSSSDTDLKVCSGQSRLPTTLRSVRPGPGNWVCFCSTRMARWTPTRASSRAGSSMMWNTNSREMMSPAGNSPPNSR